MQTMGARMSLEQKHLKKLKEDFDLAAIHFPHLNSSDCVKVLTNFYSVPLPVGMEVQAKMHSAYVKIWHQSSVWPATNAVSTGNRKYSTWSITWTH